MKNLSNASPFIGSTEFLRLIGKAWLGCCEETNAEDLDAFLRQHIFPGLGQVFVEIYYFRSQEGSFHPEKSSSLHLRTIATCVPPLLASKDPLIEDLEKHRHYRTFSRDDEVPMFLAATGNASHGLFPIFIGDRLRAVLYVGTKELQPFPEEYLLGLETLATVIGSRMKSTDIISRLQKSTAISENSEQLQQALYDISEQAHQECSEEELYGSLHNIVARLINARNFFIALRQERDGEQYIKFVYYCDEFDSYLQGKEFKIDPHEKLSMSGFLLQSGKPVLLDPQIFDEFCLVNGINPIGTKAYSLVGVPFYLEHLAGVVLVQSYYEEIYTAKDKDLLVYVARHIGDALNRKKAIDDMREANEMFSSFLRYSPVHVYIKEVSVGQSRIVKVSENYQTSTCKTSWEVIGKSMEELFPAEFAAKTTADDWAVVSSGVPLQTEDYLDGRTYSTIKFPIIQGGKSLLAGYSIDITELKNHEKEQQKIEKLESLGVLAGGIAHDFNNILTGIMGNISFLQLLIEQGHQAHKPLSAAEKAARRAAELAQQLLTFAKGGEPNKSVVFLPRLVRDSVSLMLRGSNVRSHVQITDSLHAIRADEGQISQVLNNLIINGAQAMPGGGTLTITAGNQLLTEGNNLGLAAGPYIRLELGDEGCGIAPDNLAKIFDPYFSTKPSGTGLGLATAYSIIVRHNGQIEVSSTIGRGTTFTIYLPSLGESAGDGATDVHPYLRVHKGGAVLVMDDEEMIREIAATMLGHLGYEVTTCTGGEEAIELYLAAMQTAEPYRAVIMDLTIPGGLGGQQAAERLLALAPDAYLIVSSGYSNDPIMANFEKYGFRGAIAKPYSISEFEQVLRAMPVGCLADSRQITEP